MSQRTRHRSTFVWWLPPKGCKYLPIPRTEQRRRVDLPIPRTEQRRRVDLFIERAVRKPMRRGYVVKSHNYKAPHFRRVV